MLDAQLALLGFSQKEITIYKAILNQGKITPAELATLTGIKRPTVYLIAQELLKKGLIAQDLSSPKAYFLALPPESLFRSVEQEEQKLKEKKDLVTKTLGELTAFASQAKYHIPKIQFIPEEQVEKYLYSQTPVWNQSMKDTSTDYWGFQDHTFVEQYNSWIVWYWTQKASTHDLFLLSNASLFEESVMTQKRLQKRHVKTYKGAGEFTTSIWVTGDYTTIVNTREKPYSIIDIHDRSIASSMRELLKSIWEKTD